MKLLLVTARFPYGPKEAFLTEEIEELSRFFDVLVVPALPTNEPLAVPRLRDRALRMRLPSAHVLKLAVAEAVAHPVSTLRAFASVVSGPRALRARIKNAVVFPVALAVSRVARRERVDHVHSYWLTTPSTVGYVVSQLNGIPWSASGHRHDLVDSNVRTVGTPSSGIVASARFVRTISQQGAQQLHDLEQSGVPVRVIHLGVTLPRVQERRHAGALHLVCAANLEPVKGHETLLLAVQSASREVAVHLTLVGDGKLRDGLEARASELGIRESVTFEGVVPHERLLERLASDEFDAAILTSVDAGAALREGIPVFLMESMARGLPVIATRSGAVTELADSENALLCAPGDVDGVARAIIALARDVALRDRLGAAGRGRIEREFDVRACARTLAQMIDEKCEATNLLEATNVVNQGVEISA